MTYELLELCLSATKTDVVVGASLAQRWNGRDGLFFRNRFLLFRTAVRSTTMAAVQYISLSLSVCTASRLSRTPRTHNRFLLFRIVVRSTAMEAVQSIPLSLYSQQVFSNPGDTMIVSPLFGAPKLPAAPSPATPWRFRTCW